MQSETNMDDNNDNGQNSDNNNINNDCDVSNYDFKFQKKNYENLKSSLEPFGIYLTTVHGVYKEQNKKCHTFTVNSTGPIIWKKTCAYATANNFVYIRKQKIKLTEWLGLTHDERALLLNST